MKSNLLLLFGIPLAFIAVLFGLGTGQPLWFFLFLPVAFLRWLQRRELSKPQTCVRRGTPDRPDVFDTRHEAHVGNDWNGASR